MINERHLHHMYQQWCQGRDNLKQDWSFFVEFAARETAIPASDMAMLLQRCDWFPWVSEDK
jgi:hypothetical protein